jgi:pimeloyl-ACP methyl ester carboxylesterase
MGGSSCLTFAALHPDLIDGVISLNGMANYLEYVASDWLRPSIHKSFGGNKTTALREFKKRSAEYWPEKFTMPVAITAGGKDTVVPPDSVVRLANILKLLDRDVALIYRKDGGHSTNYDDTRAALEFVIQKARKSEKCINAMRR